MTALALVMVLNAHLMVAQSGPDLPDDFNKSGNPVALVPSIRFVASSGSQILKTSGTRKVSQRWLVSESWCANCPAAKARFIAAGNEVSRVITIAEAKRLHGRIVSSVPNEYVIQANEQITHLQPAVYRSEWPPAWDIAGDKMPSKGKVLKHLRESPEHKGKHWQAWYLESWPVEQLAALHSDDHNGTVPTFDEPVAEAVIENAPASADTIMAALALHLAPQSEPQPAFGSLFNVDVQAPQSMLDVARKLLIQQSWKSEAAGVSMSWAGADRTIGIGSRGITLNPGVSVTLQRGPLKVGTTLRAVSYDDSLTSVTLDLVNAPDLSIRFTP